MAIVGSLLVRLREICTPSGRVIDVRCEEMEPQDDDVQSYPVECRTIPSHNFVRVAQVELVVSLPEVPTTYCFDCGQMVPVADTWTKKSDPNYALCEGCFRLAESAGRAKEGR